MRKFYLFLCIILITNCVFSGEINCNFTEDIVSRIINNMDEIENILYYEDIGHQYRRFYNIESEYFDYLMENINTNKEYNEKEFMEKYNKLIFSIPAELNIIFFEYPELINIKYVDYINFIIYLHILIFENVYYGNIKLNDSHIININEININNIIKIRSLFNKNDLEILDRNNELIINYFQ